MQLKGQRGYLQEWGAADASTGDLHASTVYRCITCYAEWCANSPRACTELDVPHSLGSVSVLRHGIGVVFPYDSHLS